jgi:hypothetical protein
MLLILYIVLYNIIQVNVHFFPLCGSDFFLNSLVIIIGWDSGFDVLGDVTWVTATALGSLNVKGSLFRKWPI